MNACTESIWNITDAKSFVRILRSQKISPANRWWHLEQLLASILSRRRVPTIQVYMRGNVLNRVNQGPFIFFRSSDTHGCFRTVNSQLELRFSSLWHRPNFLSLWQPPFTLTPTNFSVFICIYQENGRRGNLHWQPFADIQQSLSCLHGYQCRYKSAHPTWSFVWNTLWSQRRTPSFRFGLASCVLFEGANRPNIQQ